MSDSESQRLLMAIESDSALAEKLSKMENNPQAIYNEVKRLGYDCSVDEIRDAFLSKMSKQLDEKSLQSIAAGLSSSETVTISVADFLKSVQITATVEKGVLNVQVAAAGAAI